MTDFLIVYIFKKILSTLSFYTLKQNVPKSERRLKTAAVCRIERRAAYGHNLFQEAQD